MRRSTAFLLALGIIVLLAANSADFLFRQAHYEYWDLAANSFSVLRAKHFAQLYGPYSRFNFYHPGPAFFYVQAFGEWLFFSVLRVVRTPFQGQLLINLCLVTGLYVASLNIFAHWLPERRRWVFLCLALGLGILHFGMTNRLPSLYDPFGGPSAFLSVWSGHSVVLPFVCLLTAGASIASGRGRDLPWLVLAGGLLMEHVSEPLFVGLTAVVAYVGLTATCARRRPSGPWWSAAWRESPRAHGLAAALLGLLLLPMLLDLCWGGQSNFAAVLRHLHEGATDRKTWARSVAYFLIYGAYTPYKGTDTSFGHYDLGGLLAFVRAHAGLYAGWLLVLVLVLQAPFTYLWSLRRRRADSPAPAEETDTRCFLAWAAFLGLQAVALSLYWGTRQDNRMYYFNSWFNFGIYYFGILIAAGVLCAAWTHRSLATGAGSLLARLAGAGAVALTAFLFAGHLRIHDLYDPAAGRAMHENIARAMDLSDLDHPGACKVLFVPQDYWEESVGVGLQLARAGEKFVVLGPWKNTFGPQYDVTAKALKNGLVPWYVRPVGVARKGVPAGVPAFALRNGAELVLTPPTLELSAPGSTAEINLGLGGNGADLMFGGWANPDVGGTWNDGPWALLAFRPQAVTGGSVEVDVDGMPIIIPAHGVTRQRLRLYYNGRLLGGDQALTAPGTLHFTVPAAVWNAAAINAAPAASLGFEFPDALVPARLDPGHPGGDPRDMAVFVNRVRLRVTP